MIAHTEYTSKHFAVYAVAFYVRTNFTSNSVVRTSNSKCIHTKKAQLVNASMVRSLTLFRSIDLYHIFAFRLAKYSETNIREYILMARIFHFHRPQEIATHTQLMCICICNEKKLDALYWVDKWNVLSNSACIQSIKQQHTWCTSQLK